MPAPRSSHNPLYVLGPNYTWPDYYAFRDHLRLPMRYLRVIFRNYKHMGDAVHHLAAILRLTDQHDWEKLMSETQLTALQKICRVMNIPPAFFDDRPVITARAGDQVDFEWLVDHIREAKGQTFYFWSEFSEGAMNAAFIIMKANRPHCGCYCASFPEILAGVYGSMDGKGGLPAYFIEQIRCVELAVIYGVGCEHTTDFTINKLQEILQHRKAHNLITILCSSLSPKDYAERYKTQPEGIEIGFVDKKIKLTLAQLKKELMK